jgi:hypothetical protein
MRERNQTFIIHPEPEDANARLTKKRREEDFDSEEEDSVAISLLSMKQEAFKAVSASFRPFPAMDQQRQQARILLRKTASSVTEDEDEEAPHSPLLLKRKRSLPPLCFALAMPPALATGQPITISFLQGTVLPKGRPLRAAPRLSSFTVSSNPNSSIASRL